jgi:hypothetical protein
MRVDTKLLIRGGIMKTYFKLGIVVLMLSLFASTFSGCLALGFGDDDDDDKVIVANP